MAISVSKPSAESSTFTASFPAAHSDGSGKMVVSLLPSPSKSTRTHFSYVLKGAIDGVLVYGPERVGCPIIRGRAIADPDALLEAIHAAVSRGSLFEGSGDTDWVNNNPRAADFPEVWEFANAELDNEFARRREQSPSRKRALTAAPIGLV
jgi:hypothetical protein